MLRVLQSRRGLLFPFFFLCNLAAGGESCNQTCGKYTAPYPFGFSGDCPILFNCTNTANSSFQIGEFPVRNVTGDTILLDVPFSCNRSITAAGSLFSTNYALVSQTGLLLVNCTQPHRPSNCSVNTVLLEGKWSHCSTSFDNASSLCNTYDSRFFDQEIIKATPCSFLTAVGLEGAPVTSLRLNTAELEWWVVEEGRCSANANRTNVTTPVNSRLGFRCSCFHGFEGDGFENGSGCRKVSSKQKCKPANYLKGGCGEYSTKFGFLIGVAGIIAGASSMAALATSCCFIRRRATLSRKRQSMRRLLSEASCTVPLYSYKDIEKATDGFSDARLLGTGAYGTVYAGTFSNDRQVAVKKIKNRDRDSIEQLMNEIRLLSSVSHPNLVRLLGCCVEQGEQILVYEYMPHGTLAQHLQRERGPPLPWTERLVIAVDTAKAIAYLHSVVHPPIYHRDIKSSNILLDHEYHSKVADFGLSRMGLQPGVTSHISTAPQGTPGYVDPQYHQNFHLSDKSDVYSFGVVLVEIITGMKAVDFSRPQSEVNLAALAVDRIGRGCVDEIVDPCLDPNRDAWTLASIHKVAELAFRCLAFHRDMRPSMMEVAEELEQIKMSGWAPTEEGIFMSTASSFCSSPSSCGEWPRATSKSRRLVVAKSTIEEVNVESPVSVQDPWFSEQNSPSANSLLGNVAR